MYKVAKLCDGFGTDVLARFFYWWGCKVASNPKKFILASFLATAACSLGLVKFHSNADGWEYWGAIQ